MTSRELVLERIAELSPEDLDAVNEYLDRLQDAGDDPVRKAFLRASLLPPEELSAEDHVAIDEALAEDIYYSRDELERLLAEKA